MYIYFYIYTYNPVRRTQWTKFIVVVNFSASRSTPRSLTFGLPPLLSSPPSRSPSFPRGARSVTIQRSLGTVPKFRIAWDDIAAIPAAIRA